MVVIIYSEMIMNMSYKLWRFPKLVSLYQEFSIFWELGPHSHFIIDSRAALLYMARIYWTSWQFIKDATNLLLQIG
jgi:hypothetical protein